MKNIKKYLFTGVLALTFVGAAAQDNKHEISISVGGGAAGFSPKMINTNVVDIKKENSTGINFGLGYAYNLSESFALVSGVDVDMYKSSFSMGNFSGNHMSIDSENDGFLLKYDGTGYKEDIKATYLNIPLKVRYTHPLNDALGIFVSGGAKIGFAMSSKFDNSLEQIATEGAYVQWGNGAEVPTIDDIQLEGFGTFNNLKSSGDFDLKTKVTATFELGARYKIGEKYSIYFGGYVDYTLNNIRSSNEKDFVQFNGSQNDKIQINSLSESVYKDRLNSANMIDKLQPLSIGAKLQFAFNL